MSSVDSVGSPGSLSLGQSATSQTIPDFASVHSHYNKAISRGRHPNSFPRKSELWYYTKLSNERLARIAKGHQFWNVINDSVTFDTNMGELHEDVHAEEARSKAMFLEYGKHNNHLVTVNGIQFDTKVSAESAT
jgi:hypothetical protein